MSNHLMTINNTLISIVSFLCNKVNLLDIDDVNSKIKSMKK